MPAVVFTDQEARDLAEALDVAINALEDVGDCEEDSALAARIKVILAKIVED